METSVAAPKPENNLISKGRRDAVVAAKVIALTSGLVATTGVIILLCGLYGHPTYYFYGNWYGNEAQIALHYDDCNNPPTVGPLPASGDPLPIIGGKLTGISTIGSFPQAPGVYSLYILAGWFILYGLIGVYIGVIIGLLLSNEKILVEVLELSEQGMSSSNKIEPTIERRGENNK